MRIGIDLDGCCYDFASALRTWLVSRHGYRPQDLPDAEVWDFFKDQWGLSTSDFLAYCAEGVDAGVLFRHGAPFPGAVDALAALKGTGHTLHVVTNRSFGSRSVENTAGWLGEHGIPYHSLTFAADKTTVRTDAFIEDNVENYQALDAIGVRVFLMDRPWNRHLVNARRVASWWDFVRAIEWVSEERSETALEEAQRLVHGNRGEDYGHPATDFARTGAHWGATLGEWKQDTVDDPIAPVPPELVGLCMVGVKLSREVNRPKRDNRVDGAGYFETVDMIHERRASHA